MTEQQAVYDGLIGKHNKRDADIAFYGLLLFIVALGCYMYGYYRAGYRFDKRCPKCGYWELDK